MFVRNLETSTQMIDGVQYKYPVYGYRKEGTYLTVDAGSAYSLTMYITLGFLAYCSKCFHQCGR